MAGMDGMLDDRVLRLAVRFAIAVAARAVQNVLLGKQPPGFCSRQENGKECAEKSKKKLWSLQLGRPGWGDRL